MHITWKGNYLFLESEQIFSLSFVLVFLLRVFKVEGPYSSSALSKFSDPRLRRSQTSTKTGPESSSRESKSDPCSCSRGHWRWRLGLPPGRGMCERNWLVVSLGHSTEVVQGECPFLGSAPLTQSGTRVPARWYPSSWSYTGAVDRDRRTWKCGRCDPVRRVVQGLCLAWKTQTFVVFT